MSSYKIDCPHCRAVLRSNKQVPAGTKVNCAKCGLSFTTPVEPNLDTAITAQPMPAGDPEPAPRSQRGILVLVTAFGLFLLAAGGACVYVLMADTRPAETVAQHQEPYEQPEIKFGPAPEIKFSEQPENKVPAKNPVERKPVEKKKTPEPAPPASPEDKGLFTFSFNQVTPGVTPRRVEAALDKGVTFLRSKQTASGSWTAGKGKHSIGYAALPGLTLLECKVPATEPVIVKAADFVRKLSPSLHDTYDLGLAILFLDRLGEKGDEALIQTLALRLVAGQTSGGGWDYTCPTLTADEAQILLKFLKQQGTPVAAESLPEKLQTLPVVVNQGKGKGQGILRGGRDDNSNTQFALLGLWAARRHGVPTESTLLQSHQRFDTTQNKDGGWGYQFKAATTNTMTNVGLLGLALGHGAEFAQVKKKTDKASAADPSIQRGLRALGKFIGEPTEKETPAMVNMYFLWSVERVAMLYNLRTIGNKDWYAWGAQILLAHQKDDGSWQSAKYHGSTPVIDACFGLLFLRRSNLVQDLTDNLNLILAISDPDVAPGPRNKKQ